ncbi:MAG: carboxypeptidase-like regulatory domain-containing protein [Rhodothermaceae bacterium]|nr:carboxypeptidase-like regulatory domain-containing protein [Rhodothermaceae bacterium]
MGENFLDEGTIALRVTNFYSPRSGLRDIAVSVLPTGVSGVTNEQGAYVIPGLPGGEYTIKINQQGYAPFDTLINVEAGQRKDVEVPLAGLPTFEDVRLNSVHISRWFPPPEELFSLEMQAQVSDNDGVLDIDSLWLTIPALDVVEHVFVQTEPGTYVHSISSEQLPVGLQALIGQEVRVKAKDRSGVENESGPLTLLRVIEEIPLAVEPDNLEEQPDASPTFTWAQMNLPFPFTFQIDIVRSTQNVETIVQTITHIPSNQLSIQALEPIPSGNYYWVVSVVDEFGNRSRSREAGFRIP